MLEQLGLGGGDGLRSLAGLLGTDEDSAKGAAGAALPAMLGGLSKRTSSPEGAGALFDLAKSNDGSLLDNVPGFLGRGDAGPLGGLASGIFGKKESAVTEGIAQASGVESGAISRMLPMLAPMVMGFLGKKVAGGLDQGGMMSLLGDQTSAAKAGPFGKIMDIFDGPDDPEDSAGFLSSARGLLGGGTDGGGISGKTMGAAAAGTAAAGVAAASMRGGDKAVPTPDVPKANVPKANVPKADVPKANVPKADMPETRRVASEPVDTTRRVQTDRPRNVEPERKKRGFPWWILAVLAGIILLSLILVNCLGDDDDTNADETSTDDSADVADDSEEEVEETTTTTEAEVEEAAAFDGTSVQGAVDGALGEDGSATADVDPDGVVTLEGTAVNEDAKTAAGDAAAGVDGVTEVVNNIVVEGGDGADAAAVQAAVDEAVGGSGIATAQVADDGSVTLTGEVPDDATRNAAGAAAIAQAGVTSVDNQLTVPEQEVTLTEPEKLDFDNIFFEVNSDVILPESQATLDEVAAFLEENADTNVNIEGHTDADGDDASNQTLSQARADSTLAALVERGIDAGRMTAEGFGETQTLGGDKADDRRIEFIPVG